MDFVDFLAGCDLLFVSVVDASFDLLPLLFADFSSEPVDDLSSFFFPLSLKSVSYQPVPFSRNAAADTNFFKDDLPHSGHFRNGLSEIFCNASNSWPQDLQAYS